MAKIMVKADLDAMRCVACDPRSSDAPKDLWFHGRCHISSRTWTKYEDGVITVICAECKKEIVRIKVAE